MQYIFDKFLKKFLKCVLRLYLPAFLALFMCKVHKKKASIILPTILIN